MNLSLADVKAIADARFKGPLSGYAFALWLLVSILLLVPPGLMAFQWDQPHTYTLPDGKEIKVDGGQVTIDSTILEETTPPDHYKTVFVILAVIAGLWYLSIAPLLYYGDYQRAKYRQTYLEAWSRTKEIKEEVEK